MGAIVQGLRMVYEENGHITGWNINPDGSAQGNPLIGSRTYLYSVELIAYTSKRMDP